MRDAVVVEWRSFCVDRGRSDGEDDGDVAALIVVVGMSVIVVTIEVVRVMVMAMMWLIMGEAAVVV